MPSDKFIECWNILITHVGANPQFSKKDFMEQQEEYFNKIYEVFLKKTKDRLQVWLGEQANKGRTSLTFEDWYNDPSVRRARKNFNNASTDQLSTTTIREHVPAREVDDKKYYLWSKIYTNFKNRTDETPLSINPQLMMELKEQLPTYTTPFKENLLAYLASDADVPLVVASDHWHRNLRGILIEMKERLLGYTYNLVVSPGFNDYQMCPDGLWETFSDDLSPDRKQMIETELAPRHDKVGFFSISIGDEERHDREFMKLLKYFSRNYKCIILVDSWIAVPSHHWLVRELKGSLTMEYNKNDESKY